MLEKLLVGGSLILIMASEFFAIFVYEKSKNKIFNGNKKNEVKRIFFLFLASIIGTVIGITAAVLLGN